MAYKKDVDYQELINAAEKAGDYAAAAKFEQQRNEKILGEGLNYATTNNWSKYLEPDSDTDSGSDAYNYNKTDAGSRPTYDYSGIGERPAFDMDTLGTKPTYESQYDARIDALLNEILNRDKFTYDVETDPMYQQYKAMYNREGTRAMNDTLASAAGGAGGMNSYAVMAAQQANDYYNAQLGDRIPELYNLAYSMYMNDLGAQRDDLNMLQGAESMDYNKYLDSLSQYNNDRNFAYGTYRDSVADWENDRNFAYNQYRDQMSDYRWDTEFDYMKEQDALAAAKTNGGTQPTTEQDTEGLYAAAYASDNPANYIASNYKKYGFTSATGLQDGYKQWRDEAWTKKYDFDVLKGYAKSIIDNRGLNTAYAVLKREGYSDEVIDQVLAALGVE